MSYLSLIIGALLGWATHPVLWPVFSPWRFAFYLYITAAQESGGNPAAEGDTTDPRGSSLGLLQFHKPTRAALGMTDDQALSPVWSGYFGAVYVSEALLSDWTWWVLRLPYYGAGALRVLWRGGIGSAANWRDGLTTEYAGSAYWPAYWRWVTVPVLMTILFIGAIWSKLDRVKVSV